MRITDSTHFSNVKAESEAWTLSSSHYNSYKTILCFWNVLALFLKNASRSYVCYLLTYCLWNGEATVSHEFACQYGGGIQS